MHLLTSVCLNNKVFHIPSYCSVICGKHNKVFHTSSYCSVICGKHTSPSVNIRETYSKWQHKKLSTVWEVLYKATMCTNMFGLPPLLSGFLFVPMWGMTHITLHVHAASIPSLLPSLPPSLPLSFPPSLLPSLPPFHSLYFLPPPMLCFPKLVDYQNQN